MVLITTRTARIQSPPCKSCSGATMITEVHLPVQFYASDTVIVKTSISSYTLTFPRRGM